MGYLNLRILTLGLVACMVSPAHSVIAAEIPGQPSNGENPISTAPKDADRPSLSLDQLAFVIQSVSDNVSARVQVAMFERQDLYWTIGGGIGIAVTLLFGFFGARELSDIRQAVVDSTLLKAREEIQKEIGSEEFKESVAEKAAQRIKLDVDRKMERLVNDLAMFRFARLIDQIDRSTGFSNEKRDEILSSVIKLTNDKELTRSSEFKDALPSLLRSFCAADLSPQVDLIYEGLSELVHENVHALEVLIQHYGRGVLGGFTRSTVTDQTHQLFKKVAEALKGAQFNEVVVPYMMVYEFDRKADGWEARIAEMIEDASHFDNEEKRVSQRYFWRNCEATRIARIPTGQSQRVAKKFKSFMDAYQHQLASAGIFPDRADAEFDDD
jgi:hypothetical protein